MSLRPAELRIDQTSATCTRYTLVADGVIIWRNRVTPTPEGHAGARTRMVEWAQKHRVKAVEPAPAPKQAIVAGRYGRH